MFSVVIPTIGRTSLEDLLNSIPPSPLLDSVIVVGDATMTPEKADGVSLKLANWPRYAVKWIRSEKPGVNASRNVGIQEAFKQLGVQVIIFLDDDVTLTKEFRWESLREIFEDISVLAIGGNYLSTPELDFTARGYNLMCNGWRAASGREDLEALLGGAWGVRRPQLLEFCEARGWFEEDIHYGGAETPFIHRLRKWAESRRGGVAWKITHRFELDLYHHPRNRRLGDWLRIAWLQSKRLDSKTKAARPMLAIRIGRMMVFCRSLSLQDLACFLLFTIPFVAAGRIASMSGFLVSSRNPD